MMSQQQNLLDICCSIDFLGGSLGSTEPGSSLRPVEAATDCPLVSRLQPEPRRGTMVMFPDVIMTTVQK